MQCQTSRSIGRLIVALATLWSTPVWAQTDSYFDAANPVMPNTTTAVSSSLSGSPKYGKLYGFSATSGASAGYILVFNAASVPSDGAVAPLYCYPIAANSTFGVSYGNVPVAVPLGYVIVFSTTGCFTKTASATAFISAQGF